MLLEVCSILKNILNDVIFCFAIVEAVIFFIALVCLICLKFGLNRLTRKEEECEDRTAGDGGFEVRKRTRERFTWDEFVSFRKKYQRLIVPYDLFSLFIQMFPLLGILGTVAGLYVAMQDPDIVGSSELLFSGVEFALSSTVLGIIAAVIAKFFDVLLTAFLVNSINDGMDRYEKTYSILQSRNSDKNVMIDGLYDPPARSGKYDRP